MSQLVIGDYLCQLTRTYTQVSITSHESLLVIGDHLCQLTHTYTQASITSHESLLVMGDYLQGRNWLALIGKHKSPFEGVYDKV